MKTNSGAATETSVHRRTVLVAGATGLTAGLAGCLGGGGDDDGNGNGNGNGDGIEISPDETVELDGFASGWEATAPSSIEGETNPTLVLEEGETYTFEWVNADGATHNLEIRNDGGDVVNDLATDDIGTEGEGDDLEFEASTEMTTYICQFHPTTQVGDLVVE